MHPLSPTGRRAIDDIARRHGFSADATLDMLDAVVRGNATMAQFDHPEFSGPGQWMRGGMTMVSDMFDGRLKGRVDALCRELSDFVAAGEAAQVRDPGVSPRRPDDGWPADLGRPDSTGSQNGMRYACFADAGRLVIEVDDRVTVYDTLDHRIGGCSQQQQQSGAGSLSFTSQHGPIDLASLPVISVDGVRRAPSPTPDDVSRDDAPAGGARELLSTIERLADLHARGILDDDEFRRKKTQLLDRV